MIRLTCVALFVWIPNLILSSGVYLNEWAVRVDGGSNADDIARKTGFVNIGQVRLYIYRMSNTHCVLQIYSDFVSKY